MKSKIKQCVMWAYNRHFVPGSAVSFLIRSLDLAES
jgi:hypothetical protein